MLDGTPCTDDWTILSVGVMVPQRVVPLAWKSMSQQESWEHGHGEIVPDLFAHVAPFFPAATCRWRAEEVWMVMSDLPPAHTRITISGWRMRVEATFQDLKSRGWDREHSEIREVARLDCSLMILFLAVWWVAH